jgi:hypothetical protein
MVKNIRDFVIGNVEKGTIKRDMFVSAEVDSAYLDPLAKAWNEYGIRKRDLMLLSIIVTHKYERQIKKIEKLDCEKVTKGGRPIDLGRLSDFNDVELTFLVSILISKYGIDEVVNNIGNIWENLRTMAEEGIKVLYCKVYKEKGIPTEIFNTILNLDEINFA